MRIGIIGAGLTGLVSAYRFLQRGHDVILVEKARELGGLAGAFLLGGSFLDKYPQYILEDDKEVLELIREFSLEPEVSWLTPRRGLFYKGFLNTFDTPGNTLGFRHLNIVERLCLPVCLNRIKACQDWQRFEDITAENWLRTRGGGSLFRNFWTPLIRNRFKGYYNQISGVFLWRKYRYMGKKIGYMRGGFQRLVEVLAQEIGARNGSIRTSNTVKKIFPEPGGGVRVSTDKSVLNFDLLLVTTPLPVFTGIVNDLPMEYNMNLTSIKYMNRITMILELKESMGNHYYLEICDPTFPFCEIVNHTTLVSPEYYDYTHIIYITDYVEADSVQMNYSSQKLLEDYIPYLKRINPKFQDEWIKNTNLFRANYAYPVIKTDYSRRKPDFNTPVPGIYIATEAHLYPDERDINSCIKLAENVVDSINLSREKPL